MKDLHFEFSMKADKKKVWDIMLSHGTYEIWTSEFGAGSTFEGSWDKGSKIKFLGPDGQGMFSEIEENKPYEFVSIKHLGELKDGAESSKKWENAHENYTFTEKDGMTEVKVDALGVPDEFEKMFTDMWPNALKKLKDLAESENMLTVQTVINAPIDKVWKYWNEPEHITKWAFASDDWQAPRAENDLKVGGKFTTRMEAKDGSAGFDLSGTYTEVEPNLSIGYTMDGDGKRKVWTLFQKQADDKVKVTSVFEKENENPEEMQRGGWQAILENFKKYVEAN